MTKVTSFPIIKSYKIKSFRAAESPDGWCFLGFQFLIFLSIYSIPIPFISNTFINFELNIFFVKYIDLVGQNLSRPSESFGTGAVFVGHFSKLAAWWNKQKATMIQ